MNIHQKVILNNWLSAIIQKDSYDLIVDDEFIEQFKMNGFDEYEWLNSLHHCNKPMFIQTKVSTQSIKSIKFLESIGFSLIDTNITMKKEINTGYVENVIPNVGKLKIAFADSKDREGAVAVGGNTFEYSRFHLDPLFSNELANKIKAQWVSGYFEGTRGDQMVIASFDSEIVGFLQILKPEKGHFIIDLIGVDKNYQRRGIAKNMIDFAISENSDIDHVFVGTQIGNIPSINLYQKMDFFLDYAKYVFHLHINE